MTAIAVSVEIDAPPDRVWAEIADVTRHVEWMHDAVAIRILSTVDGLPERFVCDTRLGPLRLTDRMQITEWSPPGVMGVRHTGAVRGEGRFTLTPIDLGRRTRFAWHERLHMPWWLGGRLGAIIAAPVLRAVWRRNLRALRQIIER